MRKNTNLEFPIAQNSTLNQHLQPHLGELPNDFGIASKPTAAINVHAAFPQKTIAGAVGVRSGNATYKIGDRTATQRLGHRTLTNSCNQCAWCVPQKSIAGAVGVRLGNAPYKSGDRTATQCLRHRTL